MRLALSSRVKTPNVTCLERLGRSKPPQFQRQNHQAVQPQARHNARPSNDANRRPNNVSNKRGETSQRRQIFCKSGIWPLAAPILPQRLSQGHHLAAARHLNNAKLRHRANTHRIFVTLKPHIQSFQYGFMRGFIGHVDKINGN